MSTLPRNNNSGNNTDNTDSNDEKFGAVDTSDYDSDLDPGLDSNQQSPLQIPDLQSEDPASPDAATSASPAAAPVPAAEEGRAAVSAAAAEVAASGEAAAVASGEAEEVAASGEAAAVASGEAAAVASGEAAVSAAAITTTGKKILEYLNIGEAITKTGKKILDYLKTVIIIIIFLIFLNLFITTYFYFTTSIQATANRSNCGGASLCEAETHRHLFLEDNGNDKARDIYIIIVVIFSIYLLSEIFKSYKDGIKFDDDENTISDVPIPILILFLYFAFIVGTIAGIIDKAKSNNKNPEGINVVSSALFMFYLFVIGIVVYSAKGVKNALTNESFHKIINFLTVTIPLAIIGVEIAVLAENSKNNLFKGFSGDDFNLINPKFKAHTALHIIFLVFYIIFFAVVLGFNKDIKALHIWGLVFLAFILFTLFTFILLSSLDFKNTKYTDWLKNIKHTTLSMQYFVLLAPLFISLCLPFKNISANAIKLIVLYYVILFIIYLFYVYFVNHSNETGILSLESFQLYNWASEDKNENEKGSNNESKYKKELNKANTGFVAILLIFLIIIGGLNKDSNLDNIIYGIIVFILASYITGIVYLLYNELFPIQQASFNYKKNLVKINNEISQHIKVEEVEHTIDKNKIRVFKIAKENTDIEDIHKRINSKRNDGTIGKEKHMKNIRDIFSEISPKGSSYEDYRSQSTDQMQYEEYIYRLFSVWQGPNNMFDFETTYNRIIFSGEIITDVKENVNVYNNIITKLPKNENDLENLGLNGAHELLEKQELIKDLFKIPKANNIEYVIKKNYKYVTGEEGEIQKYNSDSKMTQDIKNVLYWIKLPSGKKGFLFDTMYYGVTNTMYYGVTNTNTEYTTSDPSDWYNVKVDIPPQETSARSTMQGSTMQVRQVREKQEREKQEKSVIFFSAFKFKNSTKELSPWNNDDDEIKNMLSKSSETDIFEQIKLSAENKLKIGINSNNDILYKIKLSEFNKIKEKVKNKYDRYPIYFMVFEDKQTNVKNCYVSYNITDQQTVKINDEKVKAELKTIEVLKTSQTDSSSITQLQAYIDKIDLVLAPFYTIGYNYENHTRDHQQMNKDTAYSIPARYYACSYLNYFPNEDGSMSKVKFAKNINEDNYNPLNIKKTITDRIADKYDENAKETKIQLAPEKFQFLLVFLVILAIILLMFLFNIIKKYFTGDVYTPQMYVLGILGVFLTIFIFGEVIFARIK